MGEKIMKKNLRKMKGRSAGFTLVELIVVLVILAILAAVLVPALLGWIDRAREKQDLLNAKNCLTAIQVQLTELYGQNGGSVPEGTPILKSTDYWPTKRKAVETRDDVNATRMTMDESNGIASDSSHNGYGRTVGNNVNTFATPILQTMEAKGDDMKKGDPYCIVFAVGSNASQTTGQGGRGKNTTLHDKYTVYFLFYQKEKNSTPMFYFDGNWTTHYPEELKSMNKYNAFTSGKYAGKRLQFYSISNESYRELGNTNGFGSDAFWTWLKNK